jgi:hypothetical protein
MEVGNWEDGREMIIGREENRLSGGAGKIYQHGHSKLGDVESRYQVW